MQLSYILRTGLCRCLRKRKGKGCCKSHHSSGVYFNTLRSVFFLVNLIQVCVHSNSAVLSGRPINATRVIPIDVGEGFAIGPLREVRLLALIETDEHNFFTQAFNTRLWKSKLASVQGATYTHPIRPNSESCTCFSQLFLNLRWTFFS
jgi:hypothetical protein